jgi:chromosome partitioning protein
MRTVAFFNNKGGVGKTSLVYHLAWMYADLGLRVIAADLDPQANLSTMFLDEDRLEELWQSEGSGCTLLGAVQPLLEGAGGIVDPHLERVGDIGLLVGDLGLSGFEDELSLQWPLCLDGKTRAFRVIAAFHEVLQRAATSAHADVVLVDVGPNLGAINRAALIAADMVAIPLAPDLFSIKGLQNLGPRLRDWRGGWQERLAKRPQGLRLPAGTMRPIGYIVMQHAVRLDRAVKTYARWMERIPTVYRRSVLGEGTVDSPTVSGDPHCLAQLKHYRSLMPLAEEARKPMFFLRPADGAIGGHAAAVQACYQDFTRLARVIAQAAGLELPEGERPSTSDSNS